MDRRTFLLATALSGVGAGPFTSCGGTAGSPLADSVASDQAVWSIDPPPILFLGNPEAVFDLTASLPAGVKRGGRFGLEPTGTPLPPGVALSSAGVLSLSGGAALSTTTGIVFVYDEPG
jgi:hypothetical protein